MRSLLILNLLLLVVLMWSYSIVSSQDVILDEAMRDKQVCKDTAAQIEKLRLNSKILRVAPDDHDCAPDIVNLLAVQKIRSLAISSRDASDADGSLAIKLINNPIGQPVTLQQLIGFIDSGFNNDVCYFIESLNIEDSKKGDLANELEKWQVKDLRLKFLAENANQ